MIPYLAFSLISLVLGRCPDLVRDFTGGKLHCLPEIQGQYCLLECYQGYVYPHPLTSENNLFSCDPSTDKWQPDIKPHCIEIDECESSPCANNASCVDEIAQYRCLCGAGYTGTNCNEEIYDCSTHACLNNGSCVPANETHYNCKCHAPLEGPYCDQIVGLWTGWGTWSQCTASCGSGFSTRRRHCENSSDSLEAGTRVYCNGSDTESQNCYTQSCPTTARASSTEPDTKTRESVTSQTTSMTHETSSSTSWPGELLSPKPATHVSVYIVAACAALAVAVTLAVMYWRWRKKRKPPPSLLANQSSEVIAYQANPSPEPRTDDDVHIYETIPAEEAHGNRAERASYLDMNGLHKPQLALDPQHFRKSDSPRVANNRGVNRSPRNLRTPMTSSVGTNRRDTYLSPVGFPTILDDHVPTAVNNSYQIETPSDQNVLTQSAYGGLGLRDAPTEYSKLDVNLGQQNHTRQLDEQNQYLRLPYNIKGDMTKSVTPTQNMNIPTTQGQINTQMLEGPLQVQQANNVYIIDTRHTE